MSTTTPLQGLPIPESTDAANAPAQFNSLAQAVEKLVVQKYSTSTARDTAITSPVEGMTCFLTTPDLYSTYTSAGWQLWSPDFPRCIAQLKSTPAALASGVTVDVQFNNQILDTHAMFTPGSTVINIVKDGYYDIDFNAVWTGGTAAGSGESHVQVNGSPIDMGGHWAYFGVGASASNIVNVRSKYLVNGETINVQARQTSGAVKNFAGNNIEFCNLAVTYRGA